MMKNYFLQAAAMTSLLCGAATISCSDNQTQGDGLSGGGQATYALCQYYGDDQQNGQDCFVLTLTTCPVDKDGTPTGAGEAYFFDLYAAKSASASSTPIPPDGTYQYDAQNTYAAGTFSAEASFIQKIVMENGAPKIGDKVTYTSGTIQIEKSGSSFKATGSLTLSTGKKATIKATSFVWVDLSTGEGEEYSDLNKNIDMAFTLGAAAYFGDYYETGASNYLLALATDDETQFLNVEVQGPPTANFSEAVIPLGTFELKDTGEQNTAVSGFTDSQGMTSGTIYVSESELLIGLTATGSVTIAKSGSDYTVTVVSKTEDGYDIKGTYTGAIQLEDKSENGGDPETDLTGDHTIDFSSVTTTEAEFIGTQLGTQTGAWMIYIDPTAASKEGFDITLFTQSTSYSAALPTGTFTCAESSAVNTFSPGFIDDDNYPNGSYFYSYDAQYESISSFAPAVAGTIKIEQSGSDYKFTIDVIDDGGNKVTGLWTGPVETFDSSQASSNRAKASHKTKVGAAKQLKASEAKAPSRLKIAVKPTKGQLSIGK